VGPAWTLFFATVALLDAYGCIRTSTFSFSSSPSWLLLLHRHGGVDNHTNIPPLQQQQQQRPGPLQKILAVATAVHGKEKLRPTTTTSQSQRNQYYPSPEDRMGTCPAVLGNDNNEMDYTTSSLACATSAFLTILTSAAYTIQDWLWMHSAFIGLLFCGLCVVESVRKALEARQFALDMAALDEFEKKLARLYSATKWTNVFSSLRHPSLMTMRSHHQGGPPPPTTTTTTTATATTTTTSTTSHTDQHNDHHHHHHVVVDDDDENGTDVIVTRKFIRVWTPVLSTLFGWAILLPWPALIAAIILYTPATATAGTRESMNGSSVYQFDVRSYGQCQTDQSLATRWITRSMGPLFSAIHQWQGYLLEVLWKAIIPLHLLVRNPIGFIHRLRLISRWVRYIRYAGPLLRLLLKLQDQLVVFSKTWRQTSTAQAERDKRIVRRSMLFEDLKRIESYAKFQTTLASISYKQLWSLNQTYRPNKVAIEEVESMDISSDGGDGDGGGSEGVGVKLPNSATTTVMKEQPEIVHQNWFTQKKRDGQRLLKQLDQLKRKVEKSSRIFPSSDIYDRVVDLTQEVTTQVHSAFWNAHLISPQTRFSIAWRLIVTCTLISELFRLYTSWHLSGTFDLRYRSIIQRLLGLCQRKSRPVRNFFHRFFRRIGSVHRRPPPWVDMICEDISPSTNILFHWASLCDMSIDVVGFLDILVWFYTGELTATGIVIPKPFFYRCILPGTLLQILDHPTVPTVIPNILGTIFKVATSVGYGRFIRWGWALYPAIELLIMTPLNSYLFKPMNHEEYMSYTGSTLGGIMGHLSSGALMIGHHPTVSTVTPAGGGAETMMITTTTAAAATTKKGEPSTPTMVRESQSQYHLHHHPLSDNVNRGSMNQFENSISEADGYGYGLYNY
jgi:hypothetical protein